MWTPVARDTRHKPLRIPAQPDARRLDNRPAAVTLVQPDLRDGRIHIVQPQVVEIGGKVVAEITKDVHPHRRVEHLALKRIVRLDGDVRQVGEDVLMRVRNTQSFRLQAPASV